MNESISPGGARTVSTITLTAPEGYEFLLDPQGRARFEYPPKGALFFTDTGGVLQYVPMHPMKSMAEKRFLLKKKITVVPAAQQYTPPPQKTWTVQEIYKGDVTIPPGWSLVDFRPAVSGESYMDSYRNAVPPIIQNCHGASIGPRIIVKRA